MIINVEQVLEREARRAKEEKPLPKVVIQGNDSLKKKPRVVTAPVSEKDQLLKQLWDEYATIRKNRDKLSTKTASLIDSIQGKLRKEGSVVVKAFMNGEIPVPAVKEHYALIQERTEKLKVLFDKIRYVEQYGALPTDAPLVQNVGPVDDTDINALHYQIRRLDDLIHKSNKKLEQAKSGLKAPKNSRNMEKWKLKIELDEAKRTDLRQKLKRLQYGARG
jgi:hypothetical protein